MFNASFPNANNNNNGPTGTLGEARQYLTM